MSLTNTLEPILRLRTIVDFPKVRERLRLEHGPAAQSPELLATQLHNVEADQIDCDAEVHRLQSEIHRLQSHIAFLQNQQHHLADYKVCLHSLKSPIRRLPSEIMLCIFDFACDMNYITSHSLRTIPALALKNVCSYWRDLTQSCPQLWSRIYIKRSKFPHRLPGSPILNLFLESSQQHPLTLEVADFRLYGVTDYWVAVCALLNAHHSRWQKTSFILTSDSRRELFGGIIDKTHPILETFALNDNGLAHSETVFNQFLNSTRLRSLSILFLRTPSMAQLQNTRVAWAKLTTLDIQCWDREFGNVLNICSNLRELRIHDSFHVVPPFVAENSSVQTLSLSSYRHMIQGRPADPSFLAVTLVSLTLPSLSSLHIRGTSGFGRPGSNHTWPRDKMNDFLTRSSSNLTNLRIERCPITDSDLIDLLHQLPSLLHLVVDDSKSLITPISLRLVRDLHAFRPGATLGHFGAIPLRRLQSLSLTFNGVDSKKRSYSDFDKAFVDMVSSRWFPEKYARVYGLGSTSGTSHDPEGGVACLRSVVMRFPKRDVPKRIYQPLKYFEEEGMQVTIIVKGSFLDL
ncbi:hypothetical protein EV359DRAFT_82181 [Lentinula novae-zelandiae]|nr:hypothetical protein EV359DRAFT_82181 [Lentinula novae-zelandiae]